MDAQAGWPLRLVEDPSLTKVQASVGDIWYDTEFIEGGPLRLSSRFRAAGRLPLMVRLPCGVDWCVDVCAWKDGKPYGDGWTVTGTAPLITVSPSINLPGIYHGFITQGVLSADCEGRRFRANGTLEVTEAINRPPGYIVRSCDPGHPAASAQLHAERQAALRQDLGELRTALANLAQLDPTDPQRNELRVAQVALGSLRGTLHGLGLVASAETA